MLYRFEFQSGLNLRGRCHPRKSPETDSLSDGFEVPFGDAFGVVVGFFFPEV